MERVFFVDYENVDTAGLDGLSRLTANDSVYIYYSEKHSRMTFGLHRRLMETKARIYYKKIQNHSKNALDKELMEEAESVVSDKRADYYIISKDKGYETFIKRKESEFRVFLLADIKECNNAKLDWLRRIIKSRLVDDKRAQLTFEMSTKHIEEVAKGILDSTSKTELNKHLQQVFNSEHVNYVFSRLRDLTYNL